MNTSDLFIVLHQRIPIKWISFLLFVILVSSCGEEDKPKAQPIDKVEVEKLIVETNKENITIEDRQIDDYLARRNWSFKKTASGLRYTR